MFCTVWRSRKGRWKPGPTDIWGPGAGEGGVAPPACAAFSSQGVWKPALGIFQKERSRQGKRNWLRGQCFPPPTFSPGAKDRRKKLAQNGAFWELPLRPGDAYRDAVG